MADHLTTNVDVALWFIVRGASIEMMRDLFSMAPSTVRGSRKLLGIETPKVDEEVADEIREFAILQWQAFEEHLHSPNDRIQAWMFFYKNVFEQQVNLTTLYTIVKKAMLEDEDDDY